MNALWMLLGLIFCGAVLVAAVIWILVRRLHKYKQEEKENQPTDYNVQTQHTHEDIFSHRGLGGESQIYECLQDLTGYKRFLVNCYVPKENGEKTEIDVILLHESGIYVLESKNFSGWIFGAENQTYWTQTLPDRRGGSKKIRFLNPMIQNAVHMKWLKVFLQEESLPFYSYIVFGNHCTLKQIHVTSERHHVLNQSSLLEDIAHRAEMDGQKLSLMQPHAIFINCARGPIVDNAALAHLLQEGKLAGAGIDVFDMEPPLPSDYPLLKAPNTILTPHIAFASKESMIRRAHIVFENVYRYLDGEPQNVCPLS